jgi:hypothetical protein
VASLLVSSTAHGDLRKYSNGLSDCDNIGKVIGAANVTIDLATGAITEGFSGNEELLPPTMSTDDPKTGYNLHIDWSAPLATLADENGTEFASFLVITTKAKN